MKPLSEDLRTRIVMIYEETDVSYPQVAERFQVSESSVKRFVKQWRETGTVTPHPPSTGPSPKLDEAGMTVLKTLVKMQGDASQDELRVLMAQETGTLVSQPTISRALSRAKITRKKKTKRAAEQDREDIKAARQAFEEERQAIQPEDIIAVDEMGCVTGMSRTYGYAPTGERAISAEPAGKGTRLSLVGAMTVEGFLGGIEVTGRVNGDVFEAFLEQVVIPTLRPGKVVLLDNASFHHREGIRELIEAQGATVLYLPAYSPEFNPIELCWSKMKAWIRKRSPQTVKALQDAITEAIHTVTMKDATGWFRHAGYRFNGHE